MSLAALAAVSISSLSDAQARAGSPPSATNGHHHGLGVANLGPTPGLHHHHHRHHHHAHGSQVAYVSTSSHSLIPRTLSAPHLSDLLQVREALRSELAEMRQSMQRMHDVLEKGDEFLRLLEAGPEVAWEGEAMSSSEPDVETVAEKLVKEEREVEAKEQQARRRTELDLEEYLQGLPEMEAVKLPLRTPPVPIPVSAPAPIERTA
jgi:hypothetical protein